MLSYHSRDTAFPPSKDVLRPAGQMLLGKTAAAVSVATCPWLHAGWPLRTDARQFLAPLWERSVPISRWPGSTTKARAAWHGRRGRERPRSPRPRRGSPSVAGPALGAVASFPCLEAGARGRGRHGMGTRHPAPASRGSHPGSAHSSNVTPGSPKSASSWCPGPLPPPVAPKLLSSRLPWNQLRVVGRSRPVSRVTAAGGGGAGGKSKGICGVWPLNDPTALQAAPLPARSLLTPPLWLRPRPQPRSLGLRGRVEGGGRCLPVQPISKCRKPRKVQTIGGLLDVTRRGLGAAGAVACAVSHMGPGSPAAQRPGAEAGAPHWQKRPLAHGRGTTLPALWASRPLMGRSQSAELRVPLMRCAEPGVSSSLDPPGRLSRAPYAPPT